MKVFYTRSTQYLAPAIKYPAAQVTIKNFSDGELFIKIEEDIKHQTVWVIASTYSPAENILELFLLLDILQRNNAKIYLIIPYFGYARQERATAQEALSAKVLCNFLKLYLIQKIFIFHIHSKTLLNFLNFQNIIPYELICSTAHCCSTCIALDKGAYDLAQDVAKTCSIEARFLSKYRPGQEKVIVSDLQDNIEGKNVLIVEDIISTASSIAQASVVLKNEGVNDIFVYSTHGIFSDNALEHIEKSPIKQIFVTNSLPIRIKSSKITVLSIAPIINNLINKYGPD